MGKTTTIEDTDVMLTAIETSSDGVLASREMFSTNP